MAVSAKPKDAKPETPRWTAEPENRELQTTTPANLIQQAITSGADVGVLERLMALQERWDANQAKKSFNSSMANVRNELPPILKSRTVDYTSAKGHTYYRYEDLHAVTETLTPIMARHGLSFRWRTQTDSPEVVSVTCIVSHRDGHSEETTLTASNDHSGNKNDIQALGSAVTYLQRYTLKAALGVAAASDDDGDKAGNGGNAQQTSPPKQGQAEKSKSESRQEKTYAETQAHIDLKKLIKDYIENNDMGVTAEEAEKTILVSITSWEPYTKKDGTKVQGCAGFNQYDLLSEKMALAAIRNFNRTITENEKRKK